MDNANINAVLEAVGELDDAVLEKTFKKKKKKPIALIVIGAAAVVSILSGAAADHRLPVFIKGEKAFERSKSIHPDAVILSAEEAAELGAYDFDPRKLDEGFSYFIALSPSEMLEIYNLPSIINENFSDVVTPDDVPDEIQRYRLSRFFDDDNKKMLPGTKVETSDNCAYFSYFLVDKQSQTPMFVRSYYTLYKTYPFGFEAHNGDCRVVDLSTGEKAVISEYNDNTSRAFFSYRGVDYIITGWTDMDGMHQILKDFGITAE
ncbi:MAG: hypothetical protein K2N56_09005 [Oscillospiraceae bacterium]|nr:hypothetical protein [Oscillospiraceae bacterium]